MELTWRGTRPLVLPNGETRGFLEDGDEVTMTGWCGDIGLGSVTGQVVGSP
jgi:fumarylacetoacetase